MVRLYTIEDGKEIKIGDTVTLRGCERTVTYIDYARRQIVLNALGDSNPHAIACALIGCRWLKPQSLPLPF